MSLKQTPTDANMPDEVSSQPALSDDLLTGAASIAKYVFGSDAPSYRRKIYHLSSPGHPDRLPVFRMGNQLCARKSTLLRDVAQREASIS
jgi:hypothetical protein